ncbi:MAG TPA: RidA family protein [Ilumatobacter sp.]
MVAHDLLHPHGWRPALGYSNGVAASGRMVFLAGMIGWNAEQEFDSDDFIEQAARALRNIVAVLAEGGARPEHLVRLTWFVTDRNEYLANQRGLGGAYREIIGKHFPAMTLVQVVALVESRAKVEIEATAVVPL